jgi:hypothetical protein
MRCPGLGTPSKTAISRGCKFHPAQRSLGRKQPERWRTKQPASTNRQRGDTALKPPFKYGIVRSQFGPGLVNGWKWLLNVRFLHVGAQKAFRVARLAGSPDR